jgi:hypothetical protein
MCPRKQALTTKKATPSELPLEVNPFFPDELFCSTKNVGKNGAVGVEEFPLTCDSLDLLIQQLDRDNANPINLDVKPLTEENREETEQELSHGVVPLPLELPKEPPSKNLVKSSAPSEFVSRQEMTTVLEAIFCLKNDLSTFSSNMKATLANLDFKKAKKNRTPLNRCSFVKAKGPCRGYICKKRGSGLCYAHHVLATSTQNPDRRTKLY